MTTIPKLKVWEDFFDALRELPELWKINSDDYKNRHKKKNSWTKLLHVYYKIDPNANIDILKKRIFNIKTCYRRELKKVLESQRPGAGAEDEHIPNLWYFDKLDFLRDQKTDNPEAATMDLDHDEKIDSAEEFNDNASDTPVSQSCSNKRKKSVNRHSDERNDLLKKALEILTNKKPYNKDDASIYAEGWAVSFRKLSRVQQIYAMKAINDILSLGQLELLSLNSVKYPASNNSSAAGSPTSAGSHYSRSSTPFYTQSLPSVSLENH